MKNKILMLICSFIMMIICSFLPSYIAVDVLSDGWIDNWYGLALLIYLIVVTVLGSMFCISFMIFIIRQK